MKDESKQIALLRCKEEEEEVEKETTKKSEILNDLCNLLHC